MVDWVDSTLFDAFVLKYMLKLLESRPRGRASLTAKYVSDRAPGLAHHLGFQMYMREPGSAGGVVPLINYKSSSK